jgi:hypothetical protein
MKMKWLVDAILVLDILRGPHPLVLAMPIIDLF